jgi:hypothetical protein
VTEAHGPIQPSAATLIDPDLIEAARILRGALTRVHPSFRFEERLAARIDAAAGGLARASIADDGARPGGRAATFAPDPILFPGAAALEAIAAADVPPLRDGVPSQWRVALPVSFSGRVPRRALIGGAIASGVSLAGAAILATRWRRRPAGSPFARAARAAHRSSGNRGRVARGGVA